MAKKKEKKGPAMDLSVGNSGDFASRVAGAYSSGGGMGNDAAAALGQSIGALAGAVGSKIKEKRNTKEGLEKRASKKEAKAEKKEAKATKAREQSAAAAEEGKVGKATRKGKKAIRKSEKQIKLKSQADDLRQQAFDKSEPVEIAEIPSIEAKPIPPGGPEESTLLTTTSFTKKSPMKYNQALVRAVTNTYKQKAAGATIVPEAIGSIGQAVIGGLSDLRKQTDAFAKKGMASKKGFESDLEGVTAQQMIPYINDLKDQFNTAMEKGGKFFQTPQNRSEQLKEITRVEGAIKTLKETSDYIDTLKNSIVDNFDFISESHNDQQKIMYNMIAGGEIWNMLQYDDTKGTFSIQNPMGAEGDLIDVRQINPPAVKDQGYVKRQRSLLKNIKNIKGTPQEAQEEVHELYTELIRLHPDSIYDDDDFDEFLTQVYTAGEQDGEQPYEELNVKLLKEIPSEFFDAHFVGDDDNLTKEELDGKIQERMSLLKNGMKGVNIMKDFIAFKTGKGVANWEESLNEPRGSFAFEIEDELKQKRSKEKFDNFLKDLESGMPSVNPKNNLKFKKEGDKYYLVNNQGTKVEDQKTNTIIPYTYAQATGQIKKLP